jgi:hypothetical protein
MSTTLTKPGAVPRQSTRPEDAPGRGKEDYDYSFNEYNVKYDAPCAGMLGLGGSTTTTPTEAALAVACALAEGIGVRLVVWGPGGKVLASYEPPLDAEMLALSRKVMAGLRELRRRLPPLRKR